MLATYKNHESIVRLLLTHGAGTSLVDRGGRTAWDWAEDGSNIQLLIALFSEDKTVDVGTEQCKQMFNSALDHTDVVIVEKLLSIGFAPEDDQKKELISSFASSGNYVGVAALLSTGFQVDISLFQDENLTLLFKFFNASSSTDPENSAKSKIDVEDNFLQNLFWSLVKQGGLVAVFRMIECGFSSVADPNDEKWLNLYFSAAKRGDIVLVKKLTSLGFDVNIQDSEDQNKTPLQLACQHGREALVPELLEMGANLDLTRSKIYRCDSDEAAMVAHFKMSNKSQI